MSSDLKKKYETLLLDYIENKEQSKLTQAYQLGREFMAGGVGTLEIAEVHHKALSKILSKSGSDEKNKQIINNAMEFFLEYFSSYEMVIRGFREIIYNLKQTTLEFENANKELELLSFLAAHDLRGTLRSITLFAQMLQGIRPEEFPNKGKDYLDRIVKAGNKMENLIGALGTLASLSRKEAVIETIDLSSIAAEIIKRLNNKEPERKLNIEIEKNLKTRGDKKLLTLLLTNLIENAWKYTSEKEISKIQFGSKKSNNQTIYFLKDNGVGFNMDYESKLFMPFQRLHDNEKIPGVGIGLAIAMQIIVKHDGKIWSESKIGEGAVFYFSIGAGDGG